jgi:hypothetical protein
LKHEENIKIELEFWKREMLKEPSMFNRLTDKVQHKINSYIPDKVHSVITATIKTMVKGVLYGSTYTTSALPEDKQLFKNRCSRRWNNRSRWLPPKHG